MAANFLGGLFDEKDIDEQDGLYETSEQTSTPANTSNKIVSISSGRLNQMSQIPSYEPRLYVDVKQITSQLLEGHTVIVNFI